MTYESTDTGTNSNCLVDPDEANGKFSSFVWNAASHDGVYDKCRNAG